jgi:uncharacterized protein (DUF924 family)
MKTRLALFTWTLICIAVLAAAAMTHAGAAGSRNNDTMTTTAATTLLAPNAEALKVVAFWKAAGPAQWFAKDAEFDRRFRERFLLDHESAARGELMQWQSTAEGALALVILLDQFPRNAFRDTPRMYDTDAMARKVANTAFAAGYDRLIPQELRKFFILPFAHSEELADQERSVALARQSGADDLAHAEHHRDIVRRFGRFPHRNRILGRESTPAEKQYLDNGGYQG